MAKMRVFLSSTFDDLRTVREVVGSFIDEMGYEPVLFEHGHIPYGGTDTLEEDCIDEIKLCDFLVSIVGKRFGTRSSDANYSISQQEVRKAIEFGVRIFIFVERDVYSEFSVYLKNKGQPVAFAHVDDQGVYRFLEELRSTQVPIFAFEHAEEIKTKLRNQWSGLYKKLVQAEKRKAPLKHPSLVNTNHAQSLPPFSSVAFTQLQDLLQTSKLLTFKTYAELSTQLHDLGFEIVEPIPPITAKEWVKDEKGSQLVLRVAEHLFDQQGNHVQIPEKRWRTEWITLDRWYVDGQIDKPDSFLL